MFFFFLSFFFLLVPEIYINSFFIYFYVGLVGIMRACSCFFVCVFCRIVFFISTVKVVQEMDPPPQPPSSMDSSTDSSRGSFQVDNTIGAHLQAFSASRA